MTRYSARAMATGTMLDLTRITVAPRLRFPDPISDARNVQKEPVEKQQRNPQAHHARGVDTGVHPMSLLVDNHDFAYRNLPQRRAIRLHINHPQPVEPCGAFCLPHAVRATRIVV